MPDNGPRNVFVYLLNFLTLYLSAIGASLLTWGLADHWFEDPLDTYGAGSGPIRSGIAMLLVAFPVFLYLNRLLGRSAGAGEMSEQSMVKKVLTYLTLFLIAITAIIDLIAVIYVFLGGDLTARFAVRGGGILMIAGFVYAYYLTALKGPGEPAAEVVEPAAVEKGEA
ncbi:MAG: DUF5671 domain-containing protein [Actinomycetota bacterium]